MGKEPSERRRLVELEDRRRFGIATLGALKQHPRIADFSPVYRGMVSQLLQPRMRRAACRWRVLSNTSTSTVTTSAMSSNSWSANIRSVSTTILDKIADKIPGIDRIDTEKTSDGRLLLRFNDKDFQDPFYAQQVSDGTLKLFAYLLLLEDPTPHPFLCIEEPENGLYHKLLETLGKRIP